MRPRTSRRAAGFTESVIREMTRLARDHKAVNLAQGFPDFGAPENIKRFAQDAVGRGINQYAITWGSTRLRRAIAAKAKTFNGIEADPETEITVGCGSTECMVASLMAVLDPGDEVIVFEPFYENYGPGAILSGATPRFVPLHEPDWRVDFDELAAAFTPRTRALVLNTPNNPAGKVFTRDELGRIAALAVAHDVVVITDEIYEHLVYDGREHVSIATLPGMGERTVTIGGPSKTFSVTGWRIGYCIAPPEITAAIRKVHDFLTVCAPAPLQDAAAAALEEGEEYYPRLLAEYAARRDNLFATLRSAGIPCRLPEGAYYIWCDISGFGFPDDVAFTRFLVSEVGVAVVPGSSFYRPPGGSQRVRFCFCKTESTLAAAAERLARLPYLAARHVATRRGAGAS
ncbi:MAG: aminotransferase class I/II-fold pyridoxal phosphate-dependent enzyme [Candidatus Eisenbacteria bacterium]|nr:aminotransferase class I/II-fold pyridoxal phosphate-dependent enzyme [Candidatus Eisenbacteria bacterium]